MTKNMSQFSKYNKFEEKKRRMKAKFLSEVSASKVFDPGEVAAFRFCMVQTVEHVSAGYCKYRRFEATYVNCVHPCFWIFFSQIRGDGTWSCILCASERQGATLECDGWCRACDACYPQGVASRSGDTYGEIAHVCCRTIRDIDAIRIQGHTTVALPDVGLGKDEWRRRGLIWRDTQRSMFSVENMRKLGTLEESKNGDPLDMLKHAVNQ